MGILAILGITEFFSDPALKIALRIAYNRFSGR
jgi:hypothetical protein